MLEDARAEDRCLLLIGGPGTAKCIGRFGGIPLLEDVDPSWLDRVGRQVEIHAANGGTSLLDDQGALEEIVIAFVWQNREMTGDDDHQAGALMPSSPWAVRSARDLVMGVDHVTVGDTVLAGACLDLLPLGRPAPQGSGPICRSNGMKLGGKVLVVSAVSLMVVIAAAGTWIVTTSQPGETRFCKASLALVEIDGRMVAPQDQTGPGEDEGCDFGQTEDPYAVLGFDCKVREPDGEVTVELVPNRSDGTCGMPGPDDDGFPEPWPKR